MLTKKISKKNGKIIKLKSKWISPYPDHPSDKLKIRLMFDEKISGDRIVGLEAKIEPGDTHQLHIHEKDYVLVYSLEGKCKITIGKITQTILPNTMIFIPPRVPHRFENKFNKNWNAIAFAIGDKSKIKNIWLDE